MELHTLAIVSTQELIWSWAGFPGPWFYNCTDEKVTQMRYGYRISQITEVVVIDMVSYRSFPEHSCGGSVLLTDVNIFGCVHM